MLIRLVYVSTLAPGIEQFELEQLIDVAAVFNKSVGITGVIAFDTGRVCQILEGEEEHVARLFESIERDRRHSNVVELDRSEIARKHFEDWGMIQRSMAEMVTFAFSI